MAPTRKLRSLSFTAENDSQSIRIATIRPDRYTPALAGLTGKLHASCSRRRHCQADASSQSSRDIIDVATIVIDPVASLDGTNQVTASANRCF